MGEKKNIKFWIRPEHFKGHVVRFVCANQNMAAILSTHKN